MWNRSLIAATYSAVLAGCWDPALHVLLRNESGVAATLHLVDANTKKRKELRVSSGKARLFGYGETEQDAVLRLSTTRCHFSYALPEPPDRWGDWRVRVRLERDFTLTLVQPFEGINREAAGPDIWKAYGVTVRPTFRRCR